MKKLILIFILSLLPSLALAQTSRNPCFINATGGCTPVSTTNPLPVDASVSASITGFKPAATGTPITVTTGGDTGTLPAGDVVAVFNVGTTNTAYCKLGASSTTSDIAIPPASWFAFTVGAATQLTCITSTSTTTVNMVGGTGLPTGAGGGGGGSGGGGAVTIADGADATQGAIADAAATAGGTGTNSAKLRLMTTLLDNINTNVTASIPAGTNLIGDVNIRQGGTALSATNGAYFNQLQGNAVLSASNPAFYREVDGTRSKILDPCEANVQSYASISITTATTTRIVAPSASNKTYICSLFLTSAAADNVGIVEGTGGTCGTGTAGVVGGTTAANGPNFAANGGVMLQAGGKTAVAQTAGTNVDLCLITSAATPLAGGIKYVQAP